MCNGAESQNSASLLHLQLQLDITSVPYFVMSSQSSFHFRRHIVTVDCNYPVEDRRNSSMQMKLIHAKT